LKLLIISHTPHYKKNGIIVGWGPTVREIDYLSQLFDEVRHIACFYPENAPASTQPYSSPKVQFVAIPPAGGERLVDKFKIIFFIPLYIKTLLTEIRKTDVVHVRCPANISLLAIVLLFFICHPKKRWIKYAGNWSPSGKEPWSYTFQRFWLKRNFCHADTTINGAWADQPKHIHSFLNPCISQNELDRANLSAQHKKLTQPIHLIFAGRLENKKGAGKAIEILSCLNAQGTFANLYMAGDGPERSSFEKIAAELGLSSQIRFYGWVSRQELETLYEKAHISILPTECSEGWPKVVSEGMAYGVVPISSDVSCVRQYLEKFKVGKSLSSKSAAEFSDVVIGYWENPDQWKMESVNAIKASENFTYEFYINRIKSLLRKDV